MDAWKVISSEPVINNPPYISTRLDRCLLPNGRVIDYYVHQYPEWVNAVVLTPAHYIVLVRQYRHGIGDFILEIPGGIVDPGEGLDTAIVREVAEETGYRSSDPPVFLGKFFSNPATANNSVSTYLLTNAVQTEEQHLDDTEDMMVSEMPFSTYGKLVLGGQPRPIFSALAYFLALEHLRA